jgi:hypothetical protein
MVCSFNTCKISKRFFDAGGTPSQSRADEIVIPAVECGRKYLEKELSQSGALRNMLAADRGRRSFGK